MLTEKAKEILKGVETKMGDTVSFLEEDLKTYRVGKANPSILNNVTVNYYGTDTPVSQVASVSVPDARTITTTCVGIVQIFRQAMMHIRDRSCIQVTT